MTRLTAAALGAALLLVAAFACLYEAHARGSCAARGGRYLCETRLSCACYTGCTP